MLGTNGDLPPELLRQVQDVGRLHHLAARAWTTMRSAAHGEGVALNPKFVPNAYRALTEQERLFRERYRAEDTVEGNRLRIQGRPHRVWHGKRWYQRPNTAVAAVPGTSNHGWGLAVDVDSVELEGRRSWLERNAQRFGFSWELQSEPWHIRYVRGESLPRAVLAGEGVDTVVQEEDEMTPDQARKLELIYNALAVRSSEAASTPAPSISANPSSPRTTWHTSSSAARRRSPIRRSSLRP